LSAEVFHLFEEVGVEAAAGVEDLDADEAVVFPVQDDEGLDALGRGGGSSGTETGVVCEPRTFRLRRVTAW
jgi:hypothetical protein